MSDSTNTFVRFIMRFTLLILFLFQNIFGFHVNHEDSSLNFARSDSHFNSAYSGLSWHDNLVIDINQTEESSDLNDSDDVFTFSLLGESATHIGKSILPATILRTASRGTVPPGNVPVYLWVQNLRI